MTTPTNQVQIRLGLDALLNYIEYVATENDLLDGKVYVTRPKEPVPQIKDYGLNVYFGEADWITTRREKIGPILTETYRINLDLVFNKSYKMRQAFAEEFGISYWEETMRNLYANKTAGGLFRDSIWTANGSMEQNGESIILRGILTVVIDSLVLNN